MSLHFETIKAVVKIAEGINLPPEVKASMSDDAAGEWLTRLAKDVQRTTEGKDNPVEVFGLFHSMWVTNSFPYDPEYLGDEDLRARLMGVG